MKFRFLTATFLLLSASFAFSQERLSLQNCIQTAVNKNVNIQQASLEKEKGIHKTAEIRSNYLPQVEINGTFQDNTKMPVTLLPGDFLGKPGEYIPLSMGVQYNTSAGISVSQVIYNQTILTSLKLSKKAEYATTLGVEKAKEEIAKEISKLYFLAQTTAEQKKLIQDNIDRTDKMTKIVKLQVDNGIAKRVDYDRIAVNLQNLQTQLSNTQSLHEQQLNMLKYMMAMPLDKEIELTDNADTNLVDGLPSSNIDFNNHTDIQLLDARKEIANLNIKNINSGYLPTLAFFGQYGYQGMRNEFKDYFNDSPMNKWFSSSYIGLKLSIPVFDGFGKRSKARQAKIEYQQASLTLEDKKESFSANYKNALNNYYNNRKTVSDQQKNIELAQKVYDETTLKYREGMATISILLQDEIGLSNAQAGYLNALYKFKEAELEIMSLNGEIKKLINQ